MAHSPEFMNCVNHVVNQAKERRAMLVKTTLFGAAKSGKFKQWSCWAEGADVVMEHGAVNGKMQQKRVTSKPKNVGRSNATTAEQQALLEVQSRINKQWDKCYRLSCEDAANVGRLLPMLASDYTKVGHRINYPCFVSQKLDGVRCIATVSKKNKAVRFISRGGKDYLVPDHLEEQLYKLAVETDTWEFDGELYIHGISLQNIISSVKKPNGLTARLEYHVFDVPDEEAEWQYRYEDIEYMMTWCRDKEGFSHIKFVMNHIAETEAHAREFMNGYIEDGFEGIMLRNRTGMYEANHRSGTLQKWKDFQDLEAKVVEVTEDNNGEGVLHVISAQDNKRFKCKLRGTHEYRSVSNMKTLIGQWINVRYQQLTDDGIPQFPVGTGVRKCSEEGIPLE